MKEQQHIDLHKLAKVAQQSQLQSREALFFVKYYSHHLQGLGLLDLNTVGDFKVYNYVRQDLVSNKQDIILTTHNALFAIMQDKQYTDYQIIFLDYEWRYASYLKYTSSPYDPVNFARVIDNYLYEYTLDNNSIAKQQINTLLSLVDMFCGVLFMEIQHLTTQQTADSQGRFEIGVIEGNQSFSKTNTIWDKLTSELAETKKIFDAQGLSENMNIILAQYAKLQSYMKNIVYTTSTVSEYTSYSFVLGNNFVDYAEFLYLLKEYEYFFLSNRNQTFEYIDRDRDKVELPQTKWIDFESSDDLSIDTSHKKIFIINNSPSKAKILFESLLQLQESSEYSIFAENVTGGRGKNLAMAKTKERYIMIGGYEMLLQALTDKMRPEAVITCSQLGLLHQQIIADIQYWMR